MKIFVFGFGLQHMIHVKIYPKAEDDAVFREYVVFEVVAWRAELS